MTDPITHDVGAGPTGSDDFKGSLMTTVDELLDWAATKAIEEDPECFVASSEDNVFELLARTQAELGHSLSLDNDGDSGESLAATSFNPDEALVSGDRDDALSDGWEPK